MCFRNNQYAYNRHAISKLKVRTGPDSPLPKACLSNCTFTFFSRQSSLEYVLLTFTKYTKVVFNSLGWVTSDFCKVFLHIKLLRHFFHIVLYSNYFDHIVCKCSCKWPVFIPSMRGTLLTHIDASFFHTDVQNFAHLTEQTPPRHKRDHTRQKTLFRLNRDTATALRSRLLERRSEIWRACICWSVILNVKQRALVTAACAARGLPVWAFHDAHELQVSINRRARHENAKRFLIIQVNTSEHYWAAGRSVLYNQRNFITSRPWKRVTSTHRDWMMHIT